MIEIVYALENKPSPPQWLERVPKDIYTVQVMKYDAPASYLHYIVDTYDKGFQDYTLFLRSEPVQFSTADPNSFIAALMREPCLLFDKTYWLQTIKCLPDGRPHHPGLPIEEWYKKLFPGQQPPQVYEFTAGSQFMVTKQKIMGRPKSFYESVLKAYDHGEVDGAVLERLWPSIFS